MEKNTKGATGKRKRKNMHRKGGRNWGKGGREEERGREGQRERERRLIFWKE